MKLDILFICVSGMGNTILATPLVQLVRTRFPDARLDLLVHKKVYGECLRGSDFIDNIYDLEGGKLQTLLKLRANKYDLSFTCFPSNKWQFNILSFFVGAGKRCTHKYYVGNHLSFLQNHFIMSDEKLHDVEQNITLLRCLEINSSKVPDMFFAVDKENSVSAEKYFKQNRISDADKIIGVHAGAGPIGRRKQWGLHNFAKELRKDKNAKIILFGGPEEMEERKKLKNMIGDLDVYLFTGPLKDTAALISKCDYFISNDTGLMHVASCFKTKQKAIFISTNAVRTRPCNPNAEIVYEGEQGDYRYPFWSTKDK